ncbi:MAG: S8 family serine peptidase [Candidatus Eisenbacteria bacterium]|nr:S8 family serine peptidase [Candidatus Eisenbacteria bacterium]
MTSCGATNHTVPTDVPKIIHILAAFPSASAPRLKGASFGISYNPELISIPASGHCADFAQFSSGWPYTGSGVALSFDAPKVDALVELAWIAAYAVPGSSFTQITLTDGPAGRAMFADDSEPAFEDPVIGFGMFGFGNCGKRACPDTSLPPTVDHSEYSPLGAPLVIGLEPGTWSGTNSNNDPEPVSSCTSLSNELRVALIAVGATHVRQTVAVPSGADAWLTTADGDTVSVPRVDGFVDVFFKSEANARLAARALIKRADVLTAAVAPMTRSSCASLPCVSDEQAFCDGDPQACCVPSGSTVGPVYSNPQWHLANCGVRQGASAGADIGAEDASEFWLAEPFSEANRVVIAELDEGLPASHEDLDILALTPEEFNALSNDGRESLTLHGVLMGGIAAALTDNGVGIKGTCSACRLLDVHIVPTEDWPTRFEYAREHFSDRGLRVVNAPASLEDGQGSDWLYLDPSRVLILWRAYRAGIVTTTAAGNVPRGEVRTPDPYGVPFVLSVGGSTQDDRFWGDNLTPCDAERASTCDAHVSEAGRTVVDICAPACGGLMSTVDEEPSNRCGWGPYGLTCGHTSGSCSIVAGAAGQLLHYLHRQPFGELIRPDDLVGMIVASARPWEGDAALFTAYRQASCPTCDPKYDFGPGMLDYPRLQAVADLYADGFYDARRRVETVEWGDAEAKFVPLGGPILTNESYDPPKYHRVHRWSKQFVISRTARPGAPEYVAWANKDRPSGGWQPTTTTGMVFGPLDENPESRALRDNTIQLYMQTTDCELKWVDRGFGIVELGALVIEDVTLSGEHVAWPRPLDSLRMSFTWLSDLPPTDVDSSVSRAPVQLWISGSSPGHEIALNWRPDGGQRWSLSLHDAGGRQVWERVGEAAAVPQALGEKVQLPSGVYFARLRSGGVTTVVRSVVLR